MVELERVQFMGQTELFDHLNWVQTNDYIELFEIELFDYLTMYKQMTDI